MHAHTRIHAASLPTTTLPARSRSAQWLAPLAAAAIAVAAAVAGAGQLRSTTEHPRRDVSAAARSASNSDRLVIPEEQAFISGLRHSPVVAAATHPAAAASTGEPLVVPFERAFIQGNYSHGAVNDWCINHTPC